MLTLPNALSASRLALLPALLVLAYRGLELPFLGLLAGMLASDLIDGWLARRWNQLSALGARLDGLADRALYMTLPLAVWWLWPEIVRREILWIGAIAGASALAVAAALAKFGRLPSYHTWGAKLAAVAMAFALAALFVLDQAPLFHGACVILIAAQLEELAITCVLERCNENVRSLLHALDLTRGSSTSA